MVSHIGDWLEANSEALSEIVTETGLDSRLVHMVTVLVLAGLSDAEIHDQLFGLAIALNGESKLLATIPHALKQIRDLATTT